MTHSQSIENYLENLPDERRSALEEIRDIILQNLPDGYQEVFQYGMISYVIPFETYPETYNKQPLALLSLGNQKNHMALYMNNLYSDPKLNEWFKNEFAKAGKKLDMGKSCVRFKKLDDLSLEVIGKAVAATSPQDFIDFYENAKISAKRKNKS